MESCRESTHESTGCIGHEVEGLKAVWMPFWRSRAGFRAVAVKIMAFATTFVCGGPRGGINSTLTQDIVHSNMTLMMQPIQDDATREASGGSLRNVPPATSRVGRPPTSRPSKSAGLAQDDLLKTDWRSTELICTQLRRRSWSTTPWDAQAYAWVSSTQADTPCFMMVC